MSCEFKNIKQLPMTELQKHFREHWHRNLRANPGTADKQNPLAQAMEIIDLKQARILIAEIGSRDP